MLITTSLSRDEEGQWTFAQPPQHLAQSRKRRDLAADMPYRTRPFSQRRKGAVRGLRTVGHAESFAGRVSCDPTLFRILQSCSPTTTLRRSASGAAGTIRSSSTPSQVPIRQSSSNGTCPNATARGSPCRLRNTQCIAHKLAAWWPTVKTSTNAPTHQRTNAPTHQHIVLNVRLQRAYDRTNILW